MAEPFDTRAAAMAAALGLTLDAGQLAALSAELEAQYPDILAQLRESMTFLGRLGPLAFVSAPPTNDMGQPGDVAINIEDSIFYRPKDAVTGWPEGRPFLQGPAGDSAVISEVTVTTGAAGSSASVEMGGTALARTIALQIPRGNTGVTPNITAVVTMVANGSPAAVTQSGTAAAPTLTFQIPTPLDGIPGREVEIQTNATHVQWRYVGDASWTDLVSLASLKGAKGDKGDAFAVDATGAGLTARAAYDAEPEGTSFVDTDTGLIYFRQTATAGVWSSGVPFGSPQNDILDALAALDASTGLLFQSGADSFVKRAIGVGGDNQIPDRAAADTRYRRLSQGVPLADVTGAQAALDDKADAAATLTLLGGKADLAAFEALVEQVDALEAAPAAVSSVAGLTGAVAASALLAALGVSEDFVLQALTLSELRVAVQPMSRGVADAFADFSGVSVQGAFRRIGGRLTNVTTTSPVIPSMTGPTTSGWTASADSEFSSTPAWRAFDRNTATVYGPAVSSLPKWLAIQAPAPLRAASYTIRAFTSANNAPTSWTLEGSNDGTAWTVLDTRVGEVWSNGQLRSFTITAPQYFSHHRLNVSATFGEAILQIPEWALTADGPTAASTSLQSATFTAATVPAAASLTVRARRIGAALTINTDLIGSVSRDGGVSWSPVALVSGATVGGITTYEGPADLSAQPSGVAMRYKLDVTNVPIEIAGAALLAA